MKCAFCTTMALLVLHAPVMAASVTSVTHFAAGAWQQADWSSIRVIEQRESRAFIQSDTHIGNASFTREDIVNGLDNVILVTDTRRTAATIDVEFSLGEETGAAPGFLLCPDVRDGVLIRGIAIFVAAERMAVWRVATDQASRKTRYVFLVQMNRPTRPLSKHSLRCSYAANGHVTIAIDQSESLSFRFSDHPMNSLVGLWGCHGTCHFYRMTVQ